MKVLFGFYPKEAKFSIKELAKKWAGKGGKLIRKNYSLEVERPASESGHF